MTIDEFSKQLSKAVERAWNDTVRIEGDRIVNEFKDDLIDAFYQQRFANKWKKLSDRHADRKRKLGLDPRTLIASGNYIKAIRARKLTRYSFIVDLPNRKIPPSALNPKPKITYRKLARVHELGSKKMKIPARPIWRPMIRRYMQKEAKINQQVQQTFNDNALKEIYKLTG